MMDFTVWWVYPHFIKAKPERHLNEIDIMRVKDVPVVRLAEVEELLDTAVMHAQWLVQVTDGESDENQDARAFLATIAAWRKRQEGTAEMEAGI